MAAQLTLGQKVREMRKKMGLTQAELAGREFTKSFISQVEKGQTRPSLKSLQVIAQKLNQPVSYFVDEETKTSSGQSELEALVELGRSLHAKGDLTSALETYRESLEACRPNDHSTKGELRFRIGYIQLLLDQPAKAAQQLELAADELRHTTNLELLIRTLNALGSATYTLNRYEKARRYYEEALDLFPRLSIADPQLKLMLQTNLANVLARLRAFDDALAILLQAMEFSRTTGDYYKFGELAHILGYVYDAKGDYHKALEYTNTAISFYRAVGDIQLELSSLNNRANHLRKLREYKQAREAASEVLSRSDNPAFKTERARAHNELANISLAEGDPQSALKHVQAAIKAAPLHEEAPKWVGLLVQCKDRGALSDEALSLAESVAARWQGDPRGLAEIHSNLGELYQKLGDTVKANEHLSKSVALYKST